MTDYIHTVVGGTVRGAQQPFYLGIEPVGTQKEIRPQASWEIATIQVDNPTGRWLYVEPLSDYIAPYTIGVKRELRPRTASVMLTYADAPAGGSANLDVGEVIVVTIYDQWLGEDSGLTYKIATDTDKIVTAIRSLRDGWGDLALEEDIHAIASIGDGDVEILPDIGQLYAVSYIVITNDVVHWNGVIGSALFTFYYDGPNPSPPINVMVNFPDDRTTRVPFPPRFVGDGALHCVGQLEIPTGAVSFQADVWYRAL
jgi:hypothetical protein